MNETDYLCSAGARILMARILDYWRARGYYGIAVERYHISDGTYGIRSNIGPKGYPPRLIGGKARK
jgi:hypothetical protein